MSQKINWSKKIVLKLKSTYHEERYKIFPKQKQNKNQNFFVF
jgi:hypothetical protein